ncbi:serine/threonine-protein kinase [Phytomonospora endophytica]|uniref:serine/threonine-protein kinase n=1 Tax=Phytomonospora endophytica TaxID=714109 RepID=UPI0019431280|nr:serine/threonine-protein kinase [Phytomonospora endophytica]
MQVGGRIHGPYDHRGNGTGPLAIPDADPNAPTPWFASAYVPGPSLREAVAAARPLPEAAALRLAAGLASALVAIHRAGLVHRDLKPSNVLLTERGPKVIDFGIARATDAPGGTDITHTGWLIGMPGHMSPEQAEGAKVGPVSDVFALGSVLAMACTGAGPFDGSSAPQTLYKVVHTEPDLTGVPARIRAVIELCLVKDPAARPAPARIRAAIEDPEPAAPAWPEEIGRLIGEQETGLWGLLGALGDGTTLLDNGETLAFAVHGFREGRTPPPPAPRPSPPPRTPKKEPEPAQVVGALAGCGESALTDATTSAVDAVSFGE